jgi:hypothetical protein
MGEGEEKKETGKEDSEAELLGEAERAVGEFVQEIKAISARSGREYLRALGGLVRRLGERLERMGGEEKEAGG